MLLVAAALGADGFVFFAVFLAPAFPVTLLAPRLLTFFAALLATFLPVLLATFLPPFFAGTLFAVFFFVAMGSALLGMMRKPAFIGGAWQDSSELLESSARSTGPARVVDGACGGGSGGA